LIPDYDVIIAGGGDAGLTAGRMLKKAGKKYCCLKQGTGLAAGYLPGILKAKAAIHPCSFTTYFVDEASSPISYIDQG
jgi:ribulose 1,5-bisphosphate synthetase/thiazole synthase